MGLDNLVERKGHGMWDVEGDEDVLGAGLDANLEESGVAVVVGGHLGLGHGSRVTGRYQGSGLDNFSTGFGFPIKALL